MEQVNFQGFVTIVLQEWKKPKITMQLLGSHDIVSTSAFGGPNQEESIDVKKGLCW